MDYTILIVTLIVEYMLYCKLTLPVPPRTLQDELRDDLAELERLTRDYRRLL